MSVKRLTLTAILGLSSSVLLSCGQQVCVMGIGKCDVPEVKKPLSTQSSDPSSSNGVKISCALANVTSGQGTPCNITSKGVPPYLYELFVNGSAVVSGTGGYGTLSPSGSPYTTSQSATYTAPSPVTSGFTVTIKVSDSATPPTFDTSGVNVKP